MSLPSQSSRAGQASSARAHVYRRRRRRGVPPGVALVGAGLGLVAVIVMVSLWMMSGDGPSAAEAGVDGGTEIVEPLSPEPGSGGVAARGPSRGTVEPPLMIDQGGSSSSGSNSFGSGGLLSAGEIERSPTRSPVAAGNTRANPAEETVEDRSPLPDPGSSTTRGAERGADSSAPDGSAGNVRSAETSGTTGRVLQMAEARVNANDAVGARRLLSEALRQTAAGSDDKVLLRERLSALNDELLFSPKIVEGDPITASYDVQPGDSLSRIASRQGLGTHWKLIQRVNGISDPRRIRVGQTLKLVRGTFHAVVDKRAFRLDLYHGPADDEGAWVFIKSVDVGLGEDGSTPEGLFIVRDDGKLENPGWVNPRKPSEKYGPDDELNPIGEFWVGLDGLGADAAYVGYGLHGTIEPRSIGREESMGCVRMLDQDIALVYELLTEGESLVLIR